MNFGLRILDCGILDFELCSPTQICEKTFNEPAVVGCRCYRRLDEYLNLHRQLVTGPDKHFADMLPPPLPRSERPNLLELLQSP